MHTLFIIGDATVKPVLEIFGQYFFPTVACVLLGWYVKYITDKHREDMKELHKEHKEETDKFAEALNRNTIVIQKLITKMGDEDAE